MIIRIKLYPPFKFSDHSKEMEHDIVKGTTQRDLIRELETMGVFGEFSAHDILALVNTEVLLEDYVFQEGETVKILFRPMGG